LIPSLRFLPFERPEIGLRPNFAVLADGKQQATKFSTKNEGQSEWLAQFFIFLFR
jgi:hypothetical protein